MKSTHNLGEFLELINERNSDLKYGIDDIKGVNNTKELMETKARSEYADLSKFYIVKPGEFVYNPRTSRNGEKVGLAYNDTINNLLFTFNNIAFRIKDTEKNNLYAEYLYLFFKNPEFDRYARFNSWGSATELFNWEDMCNTPIILPDYPEQKKIVNQYKTVLSRIDILKRTTDYWEKQLSILYHKFFDDTSSFSDGTIADFGKIVSGATPSTEIEEYYCKEGIAWITPKDITSTNLKFIYKGETDITKEAYKSCSTRMLPKGTVLLTSRAPVGALGIAMNDICTNQGFKSVIPDNGFTTEYIYFFLKENKELLESNSSGTTFLEISGKTMGNIAIKIPQQEKIDDFSKICRPVFEKQIRYEKEISLLERLREMIIASI